MFRFLSKNRQKQNNNIITKLDKIIELLVQQQKDNNTRDIHIDHVQIDYLENILFRLDSIEVDELSGKLVIGNNINTTNDIANSLNLKFDHETIKNENRSENSSLNHRKVVKTSKGFHFHSDSE